MAQLIQQVNWSFAKTGTTVNWTVNLTQPATAGSTIILTGKGGATVRGKINNSSGAAFTLRTEASGTQAVSISEFVCSGGETAVYLTLNGAENVSGEIYELTGITYSASSNNGTGATPTAGGDWQTKPSTAVTLSSGLGMLIATYSQTDSLASKPFNAANRFIQFAPVGRIMQSAANQPGANTQFIHATMIADVDTTHSTLGQTAGSYAATTAIRIGAATFAAQALYTDTSGVATVAAWPNPVAAENSLPGSDTTNWSAVTSTDATISGYTDKCSYRPGDTINFKVDSTNHAFTVEIFRFGYYGWDQFGARKVTATITGTAMTQSASSVDSTLGSTSCAWTTNATWTIPSDACPGVYQFLMRRTDIGGHLNVGAFIIGSSTTSGKVAVCLADMTWQAYNQWGATTDSSAGWTGRSLYQIGTDGGTANNAHRAYAVSFDRPYSTYSSNAETFLFDVEQPNIMFLEAQGYDLAYCSNLDLDANTHQLDTARLAIILGHQEYWTQGVYDCFTNAANAGVHQIWVTGNTAGWHTRFAAADTNRRTMICYKDGLTKDATIGFTGTGYDPVSYTGTWRDIRTVPGEVNNPDIRRENTLTGCLFISSSPIPNVKLGVPYAQKTYPIWRNSAAIQALTVGTTYTTARVDIGTEIDAPDGSTGQPSNLINLCPTSMGSCTACANANGTLYVTTLTPTVGVTIYRRRSGAMIMHFASWRAWGPITRWNNTGFLGTAQAVDVDWQNAVLAALYDLGAIPLAAHEMEPGNDTALTNPATGAPAGGRTGVANAYGLTTPEVGDPILMVAA